MTITIKINTDTVVGKQLEKELRRYPETVQFIETIASQTNQETYIPIKDGFEQIRDHVKSIYKKRSDSR